MFQSYFSYDSVENVLIQQKIDSAKVANMSPKLKVGDRKPTREQFLLILIGFLWLFHRWISDIDRSCYCVAMNIDISSMTIAVFFHFSR